LLGTPTSAIGDAVVTAGRHGPATEGTTLRHVALIRVMAHDFPWFHRWVGLVGNTLFVIGSVMFLFERLLMPATWIFVGASAGLMIDSIGEKLVKHEDQKRQASAGRPSASEQHASDAEDSAAA
jgi:hypothetical protein